jgi:hypothetical protein
MHSLPEWLVEVRDNLPLWLESLRHDRDVPRYRWAQEAFEPYDVVSTYAAVQVHVTVVGMPAEGERRAWIDEILAYQRPEDGRLVDPKVERHIRWRDDRSRERMVFDVRRTFTRNGLMNVESLGGRPRYPIAGEEVYERPEDLIAHIERLDWSHPWGAGAHAGAVVLNHHFNMLAHTDAYGSSSPEAERCRAIVDAGVDWLAAAQRADSGTWGSPDAPPHDQINGVFKVWAQLLGRTDLPVQFPEKLIDFSLAALTDDPRLSGTPDTCSIFDVGLVLDASLRHTDHRRDEAAEACAAALYRVRPMLRADGAFSYLPDWTVERGMVLLAPPRDQGDLGGTQLMAQGISMLANVAGLRAELGWTPTTEWSMEMARQAAS